MRSRDQRQPVIMIESLRNILTECISRTTRRDTPTTPIIGITPQQITHGPLVRHLLDSIQRPDIIECINRWGQTAVKTEDLVLDQSCQWEVVE